VDILGYVLRRAGASVEFANSVNSAKEKIDSAIPDIVLTDIAMPGESGLALVDYIRNQKELSVPIIVLSACAFQSDEDAAVEAGASLFIPKPFKPNDVIRSVRSLTLQGALNKNA
jgi:two-component system phosphate regulon response regulator PhoB